MTGFFDGIKPTEFKALVAAHRADLRCGDCEQFAHEDENGCGWCRKLGRIVTRGAACKDPLPQTTAE